MNETPATPPVGYDRSAIPPGFYMWHAPSKSWLRWFYWVPVEG